MKFGVFVLFIVVCIITAAQGRKSITAATGDVTLQDGDDLVIRAARGKVIVLELRSLDAGSAASVRLQDGQNGKIRTLKKKYGYVYRTTENKGDRALYTSLPYKFISETRKVFITATGFGIDEGFLIHYTSYSSGDGCEVGALASRFSDAEITCNTDPLSPVATSCNVSLICDENYAQPSQSQQCVGGSWTGNTECGPIRDLVDACTFDVDDAEAANVCPYTDMEVANFYIANENMDGLFETSLGRSSGGRTIDCRNICRRNPFGPCRWRGNRQTFVRCLVCVRYYGCKKTYASTGL